MSDGGTGRFPRTMRLKKRDDFRRVFRRGAAWTGTCFCLHVLPRREGIRLGIVISRRYGNAVARNRAKRIIREAFRRCAPGLPKADIIVRPTEACRGAGVEEIVQALIDGVNRSIHREECR